MDERNDWGFHRLYGFRKLKKGDVILFHPKDNEKTVIVKRITRIVNDNGQENYYVLGDNVNNSIDSRHFGFIPDSLIIGRARYVLFSWDNKTKGLNKFRWRRIGYNISNNKILGH